MKKSTRKISIMLLAISIVFGMLTGCGSNGKAAHNTLNLNDYTVIVEVGPEGFGTLEDAYVDFEKMQSEHPELLENLKYSREEYNGGTYFCFLPYDADSDSRDYVYRVSAQTLELAVQSMIPRIRVHPKWIDDPNNQNMKNGDSVDFYWEADESDIELLEKIFGMKVICKEFTYTLQNLTELKAIDPFSNVDLSSGGKNGEGYVANYAWALIEVNGEVKETLVALEIPENNGYLSNGDKVRVYFNVDVDVEKLAREYGVTFTRTEAYIEITGLK